jgi:hypothetical protein
LRVKNKCRQRLIVDLSAEAPERTAFGYGSDAPIFRQLVRLIVTVELFLDPCSEAFVSLQGGENIDARILTAVRELFAVGKLSKTHLLNSLATLRTDAVARANNAVPEVDAPDERLDFESFI